MTEKEEKLLRAVEKLDMPTVPALADVTGFSVAEVQEWVDASLAADVIADRGPGYYEAGTVPTGEYRQYGLTEHGEGEFNKLGPPKYKDGFGDWLMGKMEP
jgi:hypothetical protein